MISSNLHVVILAAGRGERFAVEGVTVPKPLIEFRGRSLIRHSLEVAWELRKGSGKVIVVTTSEVAGTLYAREVLVVPVSETQPGPVASALLALAHLPPDESVAFMDCDNYFPPTARTWVNEVPVGKNFLVVATKPEGSSSRDFLNVDVDDGDVVRRMEEKVALNGRVKFGAGVYGFESAQMFRHHAWQIMCTPVKEPPMSGVTASVRAQYPVFTTFAAGWLPIGTPAQLMVAGRDE